MNMRCGIGAVLLVVASSSSYAQTDQDLRQFIKQQGKTPAAYVLAKFDNHDIVILGEPHWVRQHVTFVGDMIPRLHAKGINVLAIEFARRIDQPLIDSVINAPRYDEQRARRIALQSLVTWGYQEYVDLYKAAWQVNHKLEAGQRRFRVLALNGAPDWSVIKKPEDLDNWQVRRLALHGETEKDWATLLIDSVLAKHQKALVYCGKHHAFTKYGQPIVQNGKLLRKEDSRFGQYLYAAVPDRIFMIAFHAPWAGAAGYNSPYVLPADGRIDRLLPALRKKDRRFGVDLNGTAFGTLVSTNSVYMHGYEPFTLEKLADGYLVMGATSEFEPVTPIPGFINESNLAYARAHSSDPEDRNASAEDFNKAIATSVQIIRRWAEVGARR